MNRKHFSQIIGYSFQDRSLLENALTHSSYSHEGRQQEGRQRAVEDNERLEFLGDSIFNAIISEYLFTRVVDVEEGKLTKLRALVVCERSLAECGKKLGIGAYLKLGRGEENTGGRYRSSIIADGMEAVIGAVYLDGGLGPARTFVLSTFETIIERALTGKLYTDFKTEVQEYLQSKGMTEISYRLDREEGPDHSKTFYISLWADGNKLGQGRGSTKKEAEQNAAKAALEG
ncbi:MAG: ribonuclease III [Methanosarcina sp.]|nr:ribonuclease III [Methanosarcina sp.]